MKSRVWNRKNHTLRLATAKMSRAAELSREIAFATNTVFTEATLIEHLLDIYISWADRRKAANMSLTLPWEQAGELLNAAVEAGVIEAPEVAGADPDRDELSEARTPTLEREAADEDAPEMTDEDFERLLEQSARE